VSTNDLARYFRTESPRMNPNTVDGVKVGDPTRSLTRVAVSWKPTWAALRWAAEQGCELFITHESIFVDGGAGSEFEPRGEQGSPIHERERAKAEWIQESGLCIYRCHDTIDYWPVAGIRDAWAQGLDLGEIEVPDPLGAYAISRFEPMRLSELADRVLERVRPLGQNAVMVGGDPDMLVESIVTGTGAITRPWDMAPYQPGCYLLTEDYFRFVREGEWIVESGAGFICVNHGVSEEWGIAAYAQYLQETFPEVEFLHIPHQCLYRMQW
jgi:putative NIF3 family GTP cyclohydrolase 1 type 2